MNNKHIYSILSLGIILVALSVTLNKAYAQTPGGTNLSTDLWLTAGSITNEAGNMPRDKETIPKWASIQGTRVFEKNTHRDEINNPLPYFVRKGSLMNFHPHVYFDKEQTKLILPAANGFDTSSKGYTVFNVSRVDGGGSNSSSANSVIFAFTVTDNTTTGYSRDNNIGWAQGKPFLSISSITPRIHQGNGKHFGISTASIPNQTGTSAPYPTLYLNSIKNEGNFSKARLYTSTASNIAILGAADKAKERSFVGELQELIIIPTEIGSVINETDRKKIETYLAIKYGISLQDGLYQTSFGDVFDGRSTNPEYSQYSQYIFGLGRDNSSGLYQKQSVSTDNPIFIAYVGEKTELNSQNQGELNDGEFIMFGSNGRMSSTDYSYDESNSPTFMDGDKITERVNLMSDEIFKVKLTGNSTSTSREFKIQHLDKQVKYVLISSDQTFSPENTRLHAVDKNLCTNSLTVEDGDYITFLYYTVAPGGVLNGLRMWLTAGDKANINYAANGEIVHWRDKSKVSNTIYRYMRADAQYNLPPAYNFASKRMNYYPSVEFRDRSGLGSTSYGDYLSTTNAPASVQQPKEFTTIHVIFQDFTKNNRNYFMGFGSIDANTTGRPAFGLISRSRGVVGRLYDTGGTAGVEGNKDLSRIGATSINLNTINVPGKTIRFESNGIYEDIYDSGDLGGGFNMNADGTLGGGSLRYASMVGYMAEAIYYERLLTQDEIDRIYSTFAIKYGVTLRFEGRPEGNNFNYIFSDGTSIWNGNQDGVNPPYKSFYNNIAGLIRDDSAELFNNVSNSTDAESVVTMILKGHDIEEGQGATSKFTEDKSYIFWGNNGINEVHNFSEEEMNDLCAPISQKTKRIWMVSKSSNLDIGNVTILIQNNADLQGFDNIVQAGKRVYLLVADSPEKLENNEWDMAIPSTYVKYKGQELNYNFTEEFTYFSLGIEDVVGGGCDNCNFTDIQGITFDKAFKKNYWPNKTTENTFNIGLDYDSLGYEFSLDATIKAQFLDPITLDPISTARFASLSPRVYQNRTIGNMLYLNRYKSTNPIMRTTIETTSAAAASFQIRGVNRQSRRYSKIKVSGYCEGDTEPTVFPQLRAANPDTKQTTFEISGNQAISKYRPYTNSRTDRKNRNVINVKFNSPVKKIEIDQIITGAKTGSQWMAIGDITYFCAAPLPPFNESGLSMRMTVIPKDVIMCGEVNPVKYDIEIFNANCAEKSINFTDTLPQNMYWDIERIMIDEIAIDPLTTKIQILDKDTPGDQRILHIENLLIPSASSPTIPFTFTIGAFFSENAPEGIYENQAWFVTQLYKDGEYIDLPPYPSADFILGEGHKTPVNAIDGGMNLKSVQIIAADAGCYTKEKQIPLNFTVVNPNTENVNDLIIEVYYNEEFTYVNNTLKINNESVNPVFDKDEDTNENIPGYFYISYNEYSSLNLSANGKLDISFTVKAPTQENLELEIDENGNYVDWDGNTSETPFPESKQAIGDLLVEVILDTDMDDPCISASLDNAMIDVVVPFCRTKEYIITNKNVTNKIIK